MSRSPPLEVMRQAYGNILDVFGLKLSQKSIAVKIVSVCLFGHAFSARQGASQVYGSVIAVLLAVLLLAWCELLQSLRIHGFYALEWMLL